MGSYLDKAVTDKESTDESNEKLICGASSMQGWRESQEDAHNCILDFDVDTAFFAVYDGHGGHEVAQYCAENLPDFIKNTDEYKQNKIKDALTMGFLKFDALIATPEVFEVLNEMAGKRRSREPNESDEEENVNNLYEEAAMPIEKVIEKYTSSISREVQSQFLKVKKDSDAIVGTSSASCSTSSTQEKSVDEVSSSTEAETSKNGEASSSENVSSQQGESANVKKDVPLQNGEISTPSLEGTKSDVTSSSMPIENGSPSKKGKGKAVIKPTPVKSPRPKRSAQQLYKNWLDREEEEEDSDNTDEEDQTFEEPKEESSDDDDDGEGVNVSIEVSEEESSEDEKNEDDESDDDEESDDDDDHFMLWKDIPGSDSGCTAVVALLRGNELYVANAGDSRCIVCRNGKAIEMSIDHKPEDKLEYKRIKKAGGVVNCEGRVNGGLNLSRAIGDHVYKQNKSLSDREQMITAFPDVKTLTVDPSEDEFIVLACDGIWNSMSSQDVVDFIRPRLLDRKEKLSKICEEIFEHCLAPECLGWGDGTGCDNMTAVIVQLKPDNKRPVSPTATAEENQAKKAKTEEAQVHTTA